MRFTNTIIIFYFLLFSLSCSNQKKDKVKIEYGSEWSIWMTSFETKDYLYKRIKIFGNLDTIQFTKYKNEPQDTTENPSITCISLTPIIEKEIKLFIAKSDRDELLNKTIMLFKNYNFSIPKSNKEYSEDFDFSLSIKNNNMRCVVYNADRDSLPIDMIQLLDKINVLLKNKGKI